MGASQLGSVRTSRSKLYLESPSLQDVAVEQLAWLFCHRKGQTCAEDCPDCVRLGRVVAVLVEPFRPKKKGVQMASRRSDLG